MLKRTIVISGPACLRKEHDQLLVQQGQESNTVAIEDIGVLLLENPQITLTQPVLSSLMETGSVVITCDSKHHPNGLMLPVSGNSIHTAILASQIEATMPFRKQLWKQTVRAKILNQAQLLQLVGQHEAPLRRWASQLRSGDPANLEGRAAKYYWQEFLPKEREFSRDPEGGPPNHLLNYGYAILRAAAARAAVSSGLHPAIGIHHTNRYNPFCLADDVMEPYRPFVDALVREVVLGGESIEELSRAIKKRLLSLLTADVCIDGEKKPIAAALSATTKSLAECYGRERRTIKYPRFSIQ